MLPNPNSLTQPDRLTNANDLGDEDTQHLSNEPLTDTDDILNTNQLLDNIREEIKFDEAIAQKSAMLLKMLEVIFFKFNLMNFERMTMKCMHILDS